MIQESAEGQEVVLSKEETTGNEEKRRDEHGAVVHPECGGIGSPKTVETVQGAEGLAGAAHGFGLPAGMSFFGYPVNIR